MIPERDLPIVGIPLAVASLLIPLLAWRLHCGGWISRAAQRRIEMIWLSNLVIWSLVPYGLWAVDYCDRRTGDHVSPLIAGYLVLVILGSLTVPAILQWRQDACLTGNSLLKSMLMAALRAIAFVVCLKLAAMAVLFCLLHGSNAPLAHLFLPESVGFVILFVAIALQWLLPRIAKGTIGLIAGVYRDIQQETAAEQALVSQLKTNSEPLLTLAVQEVTRSLAKSLGKVPAESTSLKIHADSVKSISPTNWIVGGTVHNTDPVGTERITPWNVYISALHGQLQANYVNLHVESG